MLCAAGKFAAATGVCEDCAAGKYQESAGQSSCEACPSSRPTSAAGSDSSSDCQEEEASKKFPAQEEEASKKFPAAGIVGIVLGAAVILGLGAFLSHMIVLEKRGKPLFMELKQDVNDDPDPAYFDKAPSTANDPGMVERRSAWPPA